MIRLQRMQRAIGVNGAHRIAEFKHQGQILRALKNLKRLGVVDPARCAQSPALEPRVGRGSGFEVLLLFLERLGGIGNHIPLHNAGARWRAFARFMRFQTLIRCARGLPDSGKIRPAAR